MSAASGAPLDDDPSFLTTTMGQVSVTAVVDAVLPFSTDSLVWTEAQQRAHGASVLDQVVINSYLIENAGELALVDTGCGPDSAEDAGFLLERLRARGVEPEDVSTVLLTHLHSDHVAGLVLADGSPAFPYATLVAHSDEIRFWRSPPAYLVDDELLWHAAFASRVEAYGERLREVPEAGEVFPGVRLEPLAGHTPGHSGYRIGSGATQLLVWGDLVHQPDVQFADPGIAVVWDVDRPAAIRRRRETLAMAADTQTLVVGMHHHGRRFGRLERSGPAGYRFVPA